MGTSVTRESVACSSILSREGSTYFDRSLWCMIADMITSFLLLREISIYKLLQRAKRFSFVFDIRDSSVYPTSELSEEIDLLRLVVAFLFRLFTGGEYPACVSYDRLIFLTLQHC